MHPFSWNGASHRLYFFGGICMLSSLQGCLIYCQCSVFACKPESCCADVRTPCYGWRRTTAIVFCPGLCRVPGLGQSALSPLAGSAGSWAIGSCCPLLETPLVVNPVHYATFKLFSPTPLTLQVSWKWLGPSAELCSCVMRAWVRLATTIHALKWCLCLLCRFLGCCCLGIWQLRKLPQMCSGL